MPDPIVWGAIGGAIGEFANAADHAHQHPKEWPKHFRYPTYWLIAIGRIALGPLFVTMYEDSNVNLNAFAATNIGLTAPLLLKAGRRIFPKLPPGTTDQGTPSADDPPAAPDGPGA